MTTTSISLYDYQSNGHDHSSGFRHLLFAQGLSEQGCDIIFATGGGAVVAEIEQQGFKHYHVDGLEIRSRSPLSFILRACILNYITTLFGIRLNQFNINPIIIMKILLLRSDVKLAGPARLMQAVAQGLSEQGCDVIFATGGGAVVAEIEQQGFKHYHVDGLEIRSRSPLSFVISVNKVAKITREHDIDILHSFNGHAGLIGWLASLFTRRKVVNTVLGNGKERLLRWMPFSLIAVSQSVKDKLIRFGISARKISVVYNSTLLPTQVLENRKAFDEIWEKRKAITPFTFCSVAVFTGSKGQIEIAKSFKRFREKYPDLDVALIFVGDGPGRQEVEDYLQKHGLSDLAEFVGKSSNVFHYLDRSHGFIHLAQSETFGLVLAEASARGLPIIAGKVGGIPEVILDNHSGILTGQNDFDGVADAMAEIVLNRNQAIEKGWNAAQRSARLFMVKHIGVNLREVYKHL